MCKILFLITSKSFKDCHGHCIGCLPGVASWLSVHASAYSACQRLWTHLNHWDWVTHICVSKLTTIGSDNGLSPDRRQAIIWTNAEILLIRTLGTNSSDFLSEIRAFSFKKMHSKMSSGKWRPPCLGLNVLTLCCVLSWADYMSNSPISFKVMLLRWYWDNWMIP